MRKSTALVSLMIAATFGSSLAPAAAAPHAPLGYQVMCLQNPAECRGGGDAEVPSNSQLMSLLRRVNSSVNDAIRPRNDWGGDVWSVSSTAGDCEDYALAKRRQLIRAGIPASALRLAHVQTSSGLDHAVLVVNTSGGQFVLDNLTGRIRTLQQSGYRVTAIQSENPSRWI